MAKSFYDKGIGRKYMLLCSGGYIFPNGLHFSQIYAIKSGEGLYELFRISDDEPVMLGKTNTACFDSFEVSKC